MAIGAHINVTRAYDENSCSIIAMYQPSGSAEQVRTNFCPMLMLNTLEITANPGGSVGIRMNCYAHHNDTNNC